MQYKIGLLAMAATGLLLWASPAHATSFSIQALTPAVQAGQSGSLDVLLKNDGLSSITVAAFSFEIATANAGVTFTDANTSTVAAPYIFAGDSFFGPDITASATPSNTISGFDLSVSGIGTVLNAGSTLALGHILFDVAGNASTGPFSVSFVGGTDLNNLSDPSGLGIAVNSVNGGNITIVPSSVPEPSSLLLLLAGAPAACSALVRNRKRRQQAR